MDLKQLLSYIQYTQIELPDNPTIQSIQMDSRNSSPGCLFICVKGFTVDGHNFAQQAVENGAVAVIAEREVDVDVPVILVKDSVRAMAILADAFYGQPTHKMRLIGITGTNGKTTTTHLIDKIFQNAGEKTGMIGTMYIKIDDEELEVNNTTPESLTLQKTFKYMNEKAVTSAVMEVSSHALHQGRVYGCDFDVAVFTNLTQDHLDYHETMEAYKNAKGLLFSQLGNRYDHNKPKYAVLNGDDPASADYLKMTAAHVITYGIDGNYDVTAKNITMTSSGTSFNLITPLGNRSINMKLIGKFSVYNVLAAVSATIASKVPFDTIVDSITEMESVRGRFEVVDGGQDFTVIVDYAHTPDSLENVLKTIKQFSEQKVFVVIGCGGDRDKTKRPLMAQIAVQYADEPVFTSDNPRNEDPIAILKDMEQGVEGAYYHTIEKREEAIKYAIMNARKGDVVLIAGKGHEAYQQIGQKKFDFDDKKVALQVIKEIFQN